LRLFSFGGYGLALAALALVVFGASNAPEESIRLGGLVCGYGLALAALVLLVFGAYDSFSVRVPMLRSATPLLWTGRQKVGNMR